MNLGLALSCSSTSLEMSDFHSETVSLGRGIVVALISSTQTDTIFLPAGSRRSSAFHCFLRWAVLCAALNDAIGA